MPPPFCGFAVLRLLAVPRKAVAVAVVVAVTEELVTMVTRRADCDRWKRQTSQSEPMVLNVPALLQSDTGYAEWGNLPAHVGARA